MKNGDDLFQLIRSLSQNEKRYFKIFASHHVIGERNSYELLFDLIDKQIKKGEYNENIIASKMNKYSGQKIASAKHYLYDLILRSMRSFNENQFTTDVINKRIDDIRFLFTKGLYNKCLQIINATKKLSYEFEYYPAIALLLALERQVITLHARSCSLKAFEEISLEEKNIRRIIEKESEYRSLHDLSHIYLQNKGNVDGNSKSGELNRLSAHPLLNDIKHADTFNTAILYHGIHANIAQYRSDYKSGLFHANEAVKLYDKYPVIQKEHIKAYINTLQNYGTICFLANEFQDFPLLLKKLKTIKISRQEEDIAWKRFKYNLEVNYLASVNKWDQALKLIPEIEDWLLQYDHRIPAMSKMTWIYNIGQICFLNCYYDNSLHWFNKITLGSWKEVRKDLQNTARMFQILIQYELENFNLTVSLAYNLKRTLRKNDKTDDVENVFFKFVNKLIKAGNRKDQIIILTDFRNKLKAAQKLKPENNTAKKDILIWLDNKLRKHDLQFEIIQSPVITKPSASKEILKMVSEPA